MCKKYLVKQFGGEKSYLFVMLQFAILLSITLSILYTIFKGWICLLQIIPLVLLFQAFSSLRKDNEFWKIVAVFSVMFIAVLLAPILLQSGTSMLQPTDMLRYVTYLVFAVLVLIVAMRGLLSRKETRGKVLLADKKLAVVDIDFDFFAGIKAGRYVMQNSGAKKGDSVKVMVKSAVFRGSYPFKVVK